MRKVLSFILKLITFGLYKGKGVVKKRVVFYAQKKIDWTTTNLNLLEHINTYRLTEGKPRFNKEDSLYVVAGARAQYFASMGKGLPNGHEMFGSQVYMRLDPLGVNNIGEALAYGYGTLRGVMGRKSTQVKKGAGWKGSLKHNAILLGDYTFAGLGIAEDVNRRKYYCLIVGNG